MTKQEAIKILNKYDLNFCDIDGNPIPPQDLAEAVYMAVQALEQEPKWIPASERLPEEGLTVLILAENGHIEFGQRDENKWEWLAESISGYWTEAEDVIAWQPLPEPYEEADE